jgi:lycopene cyclase domain-containing protein
MHMSLYLKVELFSIAIPLMLSFDKKVSFYKMWKSLIPSIIISGALFVVPDILFTKSGIWGFDPRYHSGIILWGLPLEEWLFFLLIPYACMFIHYVFAFYSHNYCLSDKSVRLISGLLIFFLLLAIVFYNGRIYTLICSIVLILLICAANIDKMKVLNSFFLTFPIMLIPFLLVNSILTGTFTENAAIWYDKSTISGIRLLTVPAEDIGYAFCLIIVPLMLNERFRIIFEKRV